jgi:peptide/nickel transport system substrate-binding protein
MEALVAQITTEVDPAKRRDLVHQFAQLAGDEVPVFPIVEWPSHTISQKNVHLDVTAASPGADSWGAVWKSP